MDSMTMIKCNQKVAKGDAEPPPPPAIPSTLRFKMRCRLKNRKIPKTIIKWYELPPCMARNAQG